MSEHKYIYSAQKDDVELERLGLQAGVIDPVTIRHLETIGVSDGWKCLEVGAGTGSIAQWLSTKVGTAGKVVATDINTGFLSRIAAPNIEIRRHDILKDELETGEYDLVHCRKVLHHLPEPEKAVKRMVDALRPGGWLLLEEDDWGSHLSADVTDPSATWWTTIYRELLDIFRRKGLVDYYFGRRVRGIVEQLGFTDVGHEGWTCMFRGGEPIPRATGAGSMQAQAGTMIAQGLITQEQVDGIMRLYLDPAYNYPGFTLFSAWGRKPAGERRD